MSSGFAGPGHRDGPGDHVLLRGSPQGATGYLQAALRDPKLILDRAAGALDFGGQPRRAAPSLAGELPQDPGVFLSEPRGAACA